MSRVAIKPAGCICDDGAINPFCSARHAGRFEPINIPKEAMPLRDARLAGMLTIAEGHPAYLVAALRAEIMHRYRVACRRDLLVSEQGKKIVLEALLLTMEQGLESLAPHTREAVLNLSERMPGEMERVAREGGDNTQRPTPNTQHSMAQATEGAAKA